MTAPASVGTVFHALSGTMRAGGDGGAVTAAGDVMAVYGGGWRVAGVGLGAVIVSGVLILGSAALMARGRADA
jgi:hypothetical protein